MIASASAFTTFGISMAKRSARRKLVVVTYVVLSIICAAASWFVRVNPSSVSYAIWAAMLVGMFLFGGQGRYGLIKPFLEKAPSVGDRDPIDRMVFPDPVLLNLDPPQPPSVALLWKNDERELTRRDRAHYIAYQPLALAFIFVLMLASFAMRHPAWLPVDAVLSLIYVVALVASMLAITLPAAIILWTEPDLT